MPHGEGDGTPLQYSCLENPRDGGACWTAVSGVAQSRTQLKRPSSSSSSSSKDATRKLLELTNKFNKVAEYNMNLQKVVTFLYIDNEI